MLFHCSNINTDYPLLSNRWSYKSGYCQIWRFHSVVVQLVGRFEGFRPATSGISRKTSIL